MAVLAISGGKKLAGNGPDFPQGAKPVPDWNTVYFDRQWIPRWRTP